jgi:protein gp37
MGLHTDIEWADSTLNLQMGCDGCELWRPALGIKRCYAGRITESMLRRGRLSGWPDAFDTPRLFPSRLDPALRWSDLAGTARPEKPWLNALPRHVFLNDMGDTWAESLEVDWLDPHLEKMAASPHRWMILTKRPSRAATFFRTRAVPDNVMLGTSVTGRATRVRAQLLTAIPARLRFLSIEPLWDDPDLPVETLRAYALVIIGGESGGLDATACDVAIIRRLIDRCRTAGVAIHVKQLGTRAFDSEISGAGRILALTDRKGGNWHEWPPELRVRDPFPRALVAA